MPATPPPPNHKSKTMLRKNVWKKHYKPLTVVTLWKGMGFRVCGAKVKEINPRVLLGFFFFFAWMFYNSGQQGCPCLHLLSWWNY